MLEVVFHRIAEGEIGRLRWWMGELHRRRDEVLETFENEGTRHEIACLVHTSDGPILVYAIEADDPEAARAAFRASTLAIDVQHRDVMAQIVSEPVAAERLLDVARPSA